MGHRQMDEQAAARIRKARGDNDPFAQRAMSTVSQRNKDGSSSKGKDGDKGKKDQDGGGGK